MRQYQHPFVPMSCATTGHTCHVHVCTTDPHKPMKPRGSALIPFVTPRPQPPVPDRYAWRDRDCPHRPTLVFLVHFVLTRAHLGSTSGSVTHSHIASSQACLTLRFLSDGLLKKKEFLVDMSSLSFLISQYVTQEDSGPNRRFEPL